MLAYRQNSSGARLASGIGLSVLSAILVVLAFPPYQLWPLVLIGWIPMLIAQYHLFPSKWSSLAPALGIGLWLQGYLGPVFRPIGTFMVWLPLIVAVLTFLTDRGLQAFHQKTAYRWFVPMGALNWAGTEMIRLFIPIAGTWAFIAYPLYRQLWLIQPVSIFGIIGMGMVVILTNYGLAMGILRWLEGKTSLVSQESKAFWTVGEEVVGCHGADFGCLGEHKPELDG
jgi:apolipoprotein N-acyltransferase